MFAEEFLIQAPNKDKKAVQVVLDRLIERYREPHRYYHGLEHIEKGLRVYHSLFSTPLSPLEFFAWAYHDAVYDSTQSDNEAKSATVFMRDAAVLGFTMDDSDRVTHLILATDPSAKPVGVINDIDLAELGASPEVFAKNTADIREEYHWVEPEVWKKGRIAILTQFLRRDSLYVTPEFANKFTDQAIENITQAIIKLSES